MRPAALARTWLAAICAAGCACSWGSTLGLEGTEFEGGSVTGPLLHASSVGTALFIIAAMLTFLGPRIAPITALCAWVLALPIYMIQTSPRIVYSLLPGKSSIGSDGVPFFVWNAWALAGILWILVFTHFLRRRNES